MSALDDLLQSYRDAAVTEREKGTYFERLACAYLSTDPVQAEEYSQVWAWADWAAEHGWSGKDIGIDLVAKLRNEEGFAAIQCKFYKSAHRIQKADIDSFISASGKAPFARRVVIDTTEVAWGTNAEAMITGQSIPVVRLSLSHLRESQIDWTIFGVRGEAVLSAKKTLRPHQIEALEAVRQGLAGADRGKLIMACGTGKTFTSLKIAEDLVGKGGRVLFMVPSLALMSQTVREWTNDSDTPMRSFAVCSDAQVGKRRVSNNDAAEIDAHDLAFPATTNPERLIAKAGQDDPERMTVVFSTYQSIGVLDEAQKNGLPAFDLIICDEAHRTTGATLAGEEDSNFVRIHDDAYVEGRKRLYMTATPRIFGDGVKSKADEESAVLASMDDESLYGKTLLHKGFGWAVQKGLLTDYKVIVLAMDEGLVSANVQKRLADANSELDLDDATKIIGCYKALTKQDLKQDISFDPQPMKRALAFCKSIAASKLIRDEFSAVVAEYSGDDDLIEDDARPSPDRLGIEIEHAVDTQRASIRGPAPIDEQRGAGHKGRSIRGKVSDGPHDVFDFSDPPKLNLFLDPFRTLRIVEGRGRQGCTDKGRADGIDTDPDRAPFDRHGLDHPLQPVFRGAINRAVNPTDMAHLATDMNDGAAPTLRPHATRRSDRQEMGGTQVEVHDGVIIFGLRIERGAVTGKPRRINHDIKGRLRLKHIRERIKIPDVERKRFGRPSLGLHCFDRSVQLVEATRSTDDMSTCFGQGYSAPLTNAGGRTGDKRTPAVEPEIGGSGKVCHAVTPPPVSPAHLHRMEH